MAKGEHKKPDYLKIQPFGQVPAFEDDEITLFESRAICRYIVDKHPKQRNHETLWNKPVGQRAESQSFSPPSSILAFQLVFSPMMNLKQDKALIKQNEAKLVKVLDVYENWLAESRYLAGDEFTLADLSHLPNTQYLVEKANWAELFMSRKNMGRWWDEISSRPSWKKVVEMQNAPP